MSGWSGQDAERQRILLWLGIVLFLAAVVTAARLAATTRYNRNPDEAYHIDAFCFFRDHVWPPDLNSDDVIYSPYGWSRVYTGEAVYVIYGQASRLMRLDSPASDDAAALDSLGICGLRDFRLFRYLNIAVYAVTLMVVLVAGRREFWVFALGVGLASIPQVVYVYSYANSDAWGLSCSVFLLLYARRLSRRRSLSFWHAVGLGLLTGLVLLSKEPFWLMIPFAYLFLALGRYPETPGARRRVAVLALTAGALAVIVAGPLLLVYPWTQGDFAAGELAMREVRAVDGFRPSNPTYEGLRLAERGEPLSAVLTDAQWWRWTGESIYGLFGYMAVYLPQWLYAAAAAIGLLGLGFTFDTLTQKWREIAAGVMLTLAVALALVLTNVAASLYNSWVIDYQPQGRYLFPSLLPFAYLWAGLYLREPVWMQRTNWALLAVLWCLGMYVLWSVALTASQLIGA